MLKKLIAICLLVLSARAEQITLGLVTDLSWQGTMAKWTKDQPSGPQPIAWYKLDDNAADYVVADSAGSYTATASALTSGRSTNGVLNSCLSFDGSTDGVISTSANNTFTALTVTCWVNLSFAIQWGRIVAKGDGGYSSSFLLGIADSGGIYFSILTGSDQTYPSGGNSVPVGEWVFLTGTWDGETITTYMNGVFDASTQYSGIIYNSTSPFYVGTSADGSSYNTAGLIDEVRIYDTSLSAIQVTNLFTSYNYTPPQPPAQTTIYFDATYYYPGDAYIDGVYADPTSCQYSGTTFDTISTTYAYGAYYFLEWRDSNGTPYDLNDNLPPDQTTLYAYWY